MASLVSYDELEKSDLAELRFGDNGFLWFSDENQGWIVESYRKQVGIIAWAEFPEVINGTPEGWLSERAEQIIDASR